MCLFRLPLFFSILLIFSTSCEKPQSLPPKELNKYVLAPENGLAISHKMGDFEITAAYRPTDIMIAQELDFTDPNKDSTIKRLRSKYSDNYYFLLALSKDGKEALHQIGTDQYSQLVQRLSFQMADYVFITSGNDTLKVADYILDRTFGMATATNMLFAFKKKDSLKADWLQFNLKEFGLGIGSTRFRFKKQDLEDIPSALF